MKFEPVKSATEALELAAMISDTGRPEWDDYDLVIMQSATAFTSYVRLGVRYGMKCERPTMAGAAIEAKLMERTYSRPALVYALLPSGSTTLVPRAVWFELVERIERFCHKGGSREIALRMKPNYELSPKRKKR